MSSIINGIKMFTTSVAAFSSSEVFSSCAGVAASDIIETTSVGLGNITTGMVVAFYQVTGGTCMAGITSGNEYVVSTVTTATSSFQVYAGQGSSAVDITANSTGNDYYIIVKGGNMIAVGEYKQATVAIQPTSGYDGEFRFIGSFQRDLDTDGRLTSGNFFVPMAYSDIGATSNPIIGTTYINTTGGTSTSWNIYTLDVSGLETVSMRTRNFIAGGINATVNLYRE